MADNQQTLENLLVDEEEISEEILHNLLIEYIQIGKQSGDLIPREPFQEIPAKQKVVIVLLSQQARNKLDMVESEWMTPSEISEQSGIKKGTVYPTVRELSNNGLAEDDYGSYRIPSHSLQRARASIEEADNDD